MEGNKLLVLLLLFLPCGTVWAQSNTLKKNGHKGGTIYFALGTHRSFYSKSDISFKSSIYPLFDFTLQNVRAKDDQGLKFNNSGAPQYSYQLGYYSNRNNWGIEFNFDHIKYFMRQFQRVQLQGTINEHLYNTDTIITPDFVQFEHSDGANYALLKWVKWKRLVQGKDQKKVLNLVFKAGAGPVIPKTNSTIMGKHRDDTYKVSGWVIALEGGLRYNFSKLFFAEVNAKGAYADYRRFLIADGTGSQQWFGLHPGLLVGLQLAR